MGEGKHSLFSSILPQTGPKHGQSHHLHPPETCRTWCWPSARSLQAKAKKSWSYTALKCHRVLRADKPAASLRHTAFLLTPRLHPQELQAQLNALLGQTSVPPNRAATKQCHRAGGPENRSGEDGGGRAGRWGLATVLQTVLRCFAVRVSELL